MNHPTSPLPLVAPDLLALSEFADETDLLPLAFRESLVKKGQFVLWSGRTANTGELPLELTIAFHSGVPSRSGRETAWFELQSVAPAKRYVHAEGGLTFFNGELVDYDGVSELPRAVSRVLKAYGFFMGEHVDPEVDDDLAPVVWVQDGDAFPGLKRARFSAWGWPFAPEHVDAKRLLVNQGLAAVQVSADRGRFRLRAGNAEAVSPVFDAPTWGDLMSWFDAAMVVVGDCHHVFLEGLTWDAGDKTWTIQTGS